MLRNFLRTSRRRNELSTEALESEASPVPLDSEQASRLNPPPSDYGRSIFADRATITVHAGNGGHGCISFLREKYISAGPANGGDGGTGGNIWIRAVREETSLHKLQRRSILKAGRGQNGQGKTKGGERGDDVVIEVPVGTVVREVSRYDPVVAEEEKRRIEMGKEESDTRSTPYKWDRQKWLLYPAITKEDVATADFPRYPKPRKSALSMQQVQGPISLDLSKHMEKPLLLAAGAVGGLGNPHFVSKTAPRPKFASKGLDGMKITLELELKLLADVGLVGHPNAGKSTLLRAISASRARVGNWAFTTLQPNIGTVVLDDHRGRPAEASKYADGTPRTNFTIADIPGLVKDAHLDKGLGISFLRHVERARVLAFVIDLSAGDAVAALKGLWTELAAYEKLKIIEEKENLGPGMVQWTPFTSEEDALNNRSEVIFMDGVKKYDATEAPSIVGKPWFVVATKADLEGTKERFQELKEYLEKVQSGEEGHPMGSEDVWKGKLEAIPISAINGHGVERIRQWTVGLLDN